MALGNHHSPCWPDPDPQCCEQWDNEDVTDAQRDRAAAIASSVLWRLSGRRLGVCSATIRPCGRDCEGASTYFGGGYQRGAVFTPQLVNGTTWVNTTCPCPNECSCCHVCQLEIPGGPIQEIVEVTIDGVVIDPATYRIDNHRWLVRESGFDCWPRCQDLGADPGEPNTFTITYRRGIPLDAAALAAFSTYACELLKACIPGCACRLPKRVQTITRQGTTISFVDPMDFLDRGRTGLEDVDAWLAAVNPSRLQERSRVYSPDIAPARTTTWPH